MVGTTNFLKREEVLDNYDPKREYALEILKERGLIEDAWDAVELFEDAIASYTGAPYAVAVDNCTDALFLCLKRCKVPGNTVVIPKRTYCSVPMTITNAGFGYKFSDIEWSGAYQLAPTTIYDSALRLTKDMYERGTFQCLSFHRKKILKLTKGGMILTDDLESAEWFKEVRSKGRHPHNKVFYTDEVFNSMGWNMYMHPEDAAKGFLIFEELPKCNEDAGGHQTYYDLSQRELFIRHETH